MTLFIDEAASPPWDAFTENEKRCPKCRRLAMPYDGGKCPCGTDYPLPKWVDLKDCYMTIAHAANVDFDGQPAHSITDCPDGTWFCTCTKAGLDFCAETGRVLPSSRS